MSKSENRIKKTKLYRSEEIISVNEKYKLMDQWWLVIELKISWLEKSMSEEEKLAQWSWRGWKHYGVIGNQWRENREMAWNNNLKREYRNEIYKKMRENQKQWYNENLTKICNVWNVDNEKMKINEETRKWKIEYNENKWNIKK